MLVLTYACLPFELAYNWTRIQHFVVGGLGMFLLLERWNIRSSISLLSSLTYEFAGCHAMSFQHPWIESTFMYYPYLWLVWDHFARHGGGRREIILAAFLLTGIFYSGGIQTHTYIVLFLLAFGLGYAGKDAQTWERFLPAVVIPGLIAVCLAAPVLGEQVELFFQSGRPVPLHKNKLEWLCGIASLAGIYPWGLGAFRTLDLSWQATADGRLLAVQKTEPCSSQIEIPADARILDLRYQPRYLRQARWLQLIGVLGIGITGVRPMTGPREKRVLLRQSVSQRD